MLGVIMRFRWKVREPTIVARLVTCPYSFLFQPVLTPWDISQLLRVLLTNGKCAARVVRANIQSEISLLVRVTHERREDVGFVVLDVVFFEPLWWARGCGWLNIFASRSCGVAFL